MTENLVQDTGQDSSDVCQTPDRTTDKPDSQETSGNQSTLILDQTPLFQKRMFTELGLITYRRQQLNSRRIMLLKVQKLKRKAEENQGPENSEQPDELEAIQLEMEELVERENKLIELTNAVSGNQNYLMGHSEPPSTTLDNSEADDPQLSITDTVEVEKLSNVPAVVQCPSCNQIITTETHHKLGGTVRLLCLMCSLFGCLAGCCLIPFCVKSLWDVQHHCPMCHTNIHTFTRI